MSNNSEVSIDFSSYRSLILKLFKIIFFDQRNLSNQKCRKIKSKVILNNFIFIFSIINSVAFYLLVAIDSVKNYDVNKITIIVTCFLTPIMIFIRNGILYMNKSNIEKVLKAMMRSYSKKEEEKCEFLSYRKIYELYVRVMVTIAAVSSFVFYIEPVWKFIKNGETIFPEVNPFYGTQMSPYLYPFAILWSIWAFGSSMIILSLLNEMILHSAITIVAIECEILKKDFQEFHRKSYLEDRLKTLIKRHKIMSNKARKMESAISLLAFVNFAVASIQICSCCFLAAIATEFSKQVEMIFYGLFTLLKVLFDYYFGQILETSSENLAHGIYDCGWEKLKNPKLTKKLILAIQRAQNPTMITALKFVKINLHQYWNVRKFLRYF